MSNINELLIKIDGLNEKIKVKSRKALKEKLMIQDEIKNLEEERFKAGFRGDVLTVEKYNNEIKKLNQKMSTDKVFPLKSEIKSHQKKITQIIINYYKNGLRINEILKKENVPVDIRDKWISSSNFGKNTGYLFVDFIKKGKENKWKYYNPITEVKIESKSLRTLELTLKNYDEKLFGFDDNLVKQSKNRDIQLNPIVNYGWNDSKFIKSKPKNRAKTKKSNPKKVKKTKIEQSVSKKVNKIAKPENKVSLREEEIKKLKNKEKNDSFKENYAIILDYLERGYLNKQMTKYEGKSVAQAIGIDNFTLLELAPKNGVDLEIGEIVYIGKGKRDKVYRVLGKLSVNDLTGLSMLEIDDAIVDIVNASYDEYVDFFNNSGGSVGVHAIGMLPNVTGSVVREILKQRDIKKFKDMKDLKTRVPSFKDPHKSIVLKIKEELGLIESKRMKKYYLFTNADSNRR